LYDSNVLRLSFSAIGVITTVAGNGGKVSSGDGGKATSARLNDPQSVAVDALGNIYIVDEFSHRIRMISGINGLITTVAGTGEVGYSGDGGQAMSARLNFPKGVAVDASGNIYIVDTANHCIRKVTKSTGVITTVAGGGDYDFDNVHDGGQATSAVLASPLGVTLDASGNVYITDTKHFRIRMVTKSTGVITTVAGNGTAGYFGDGGQATSSKLSFPYGIAVDASGNIYIADQYNHRIRMITNGVITTVAGTGEVGYSGDGGLATSANISYPCGIALDASGNLYMTLRGSNGNRVRKVTKSTGVITTVAGNGTAGYFGDGGQATSAKLNSPGGVAVDASGNVYIADTLNYRIRTFAANELPTSAPSTVPISTPPPSTVPISTPPPSTAPISSPLPSTAPSATSVPSTIPASSLIASIPTSSSTALSANVIPGVIGGVGGLLFILLILAAICCCRRR
jgi:trimeric autotransporter adhesin